jgi:hypothetical protein
MILVIVPAVGIMIAAFLFRSRVSGPRTAEVLFVVALSVLAPLLITGRGSDEAQAWSGVLALAMAASFWTLAGVSLLTRRWSDDSGAAMAASVTAWGLGVIFALLDLLYSRGAMVGLLALVPYSLVPIAVFFGLGWFSLRERA